MAKKPEKPRQRYAPQRFDTRGIPVSPPWALPPWRPPDRSEAEQFQKETFARWQAGQSLARWAAKVSEMIFRTYSADERPPDLNWYTDFDTPRFAALNKAYAGYASVAELEGLKARTQYLISSIGSFVHLKSRLVSSTPVFFRVSEGLMQRLLFTELTNVTPAELRLPFPGFYVEVPRTVIQYRDELTPDIWHGLESIGVAEGMTPEHHEGPIFGPVPKGTYQLRAGRRMALWIHAGSPPPISKDPFDDSVYFTQFPLNEENTPVEELMAREQAAHPREWSVGQKPVLRFAGKDYTPPEAAVLISRFVVNLILYLGDKERRDVEREDADRITELHRLAGRFKTGKKGERVRNELRALNAEQTYLVGKSIKVSPKLAEAIASREKGEAWQLRYRVIVRGHWRRKKGMAAAYASVSEAPVHDRLWIQPYVKGPEAGEIFGREYDIEENPCS